MRVPGKVNWNPGISAAASAKVVLPAMAADLFSAGREAADGKPKVKRLHDFRLLAKRFRYSIELFRPLYGPAMDRRLRTLRKLQEKLGKISDCAATRDLLKVYAGEGGKRGKLKQVLKYIDEEERTRTLDFLKYWSEEFNAPGEEEHWSRYLRDYAGRGRGTGAA